MHMPTPDRDQQIIQTHAAFICQAVELLQRHDADQMLTALLANVADNGWNALANVVRQFAAGRRDLLIMHRIWTMEDRVIAAAILRGLQDPVDPAGPHRKAIRRLRPRPGAYDPRGVERQRAGAEPDGQMAEQMSKVGGDMSRVAAVIRPMINGEREQSACARLDVRGRQLVLQILDELGRLGSH